MPTRFRYLFPNCDPDSCPLTASPGNPGELFPVGWAGFRPSVAVNGLGVAESLANQLTPEPRDQQPLLPVAKKASGPIRKAAIDDGIPVSIRRLGRDPQRKGFVVAQTLQTLLIYPESGFRELVTQGFDHFGFEERMPPVPERRDPAFAKKAL